MTLKKNKLNSLLAPFAINLLLLIYLVVFQADAWWWSPDRASVLADIPVKIVQFIQFIAIGNLLSRTVWYLGDKSA